VKLNNDYVSFTKNTFLQAILQKEL
jgi:hypothetical protein